MVGEVGECRRLRRRRRPSLLGLLCPAAPAAPAPAAAAEPIQREPVHVRNRRLHLHLHRRHLHHRLRTTGTRARTTARTVRRKMGVHGARSPSATATTTSVTSPPSQSPPCRSAPRAACPSAKNSTAPRLSQRGLSTLTRICQVHVRERYEWRRAAVGGQRAGWPAAGIRTTCTLLASTGRLHLLRRLLLPRPNRGGADVGAVRGGRRRMLCATPDALARRVGGWVNKFVIVGSTVYTRGEHRMIVTRMNKSGIDVYEVATFEVSFIIKGS